MGAVLGGIAGSQKDVANTTSTSTVAPGAMLDGEASGLGAQNQGLKNLQGMVGAGANQGDVSSAAFNSRSLASLFQQYAQSGGVPTQQQQGAANQYAASQFAPQRQAMQTQFQQQNIDTSRMAGMLGRPVNDPTLQAKLQLGQSQQMGQLNAQQQAFSSQYANQISQNGLQYALGQNQVLNGLATQAFQNQAAIMGFGNQIANQGLNWQLQTATRTGTGETSSGGGLKGAIEGGMAGQAMDINNMKNIMSMGGGATSMFCDRRLKTDIVDAEREVGDLFATLPAYRFRYKPETELGNGLLYGPMAQDLERHEIGKNFVIETPKGKAIDGSRLIPALIAQVSTMERRLRALEEKGGGK